MGRTIASADWHGNYRGLMQVIERSGFDYDEDTLIFLGDVCDGWPEVYECIEELTRIRNLVMLRGNHKFCASIQ